MKDKVSEEVEVGKKESGIKHGRKKKADNKRSRRERRNMFNRCFKTLFGVRCRV